MRLLLLVLALAAFPTAPSSGAASAAADPGAPASVAIAFDATREIGSVAEGYADLPRRRAATVDDPVRIASISKLVVAIGVMKLVEQRRLALDEDVSRWLGWTLRNPAFPGRPITLRMLLSHTSSLRDGDDAYVIPLGGTLRATLAASETWDSRRGPGDGYFTYANLNFPVVAAIVERVTGERFDLWMRREVLDAMGVDACFNWPTCSDAAVARAVTLPGAGGSVRDDLGGRRPDCPVFVRDGDRCDLSLWQPGENGALFSPQGGLRISARGLARVGRLLLGRGTLDGVRVLSPQSIETMLTPAWRFDGGNGDTDAGFYCAYGLAVQLIPTPGVPGCADDPAGDGVSRAGHAGDAYGLRSGLWIDRARGTGGAYFVTGLGDDPPRGTSAFRAAEEAALRRSLEILDRTSRAAGAAERK